jgi:hypothetical protein
LEPTNRAHETKSAARFPPRLAKELVGAGDRL